VSGQARSGGASGAMILRQAKPWERRARRIRCCLETQSTAIREDIRIAFPKPFPDGINSADAQARTAYNRSGDLIVAMPHQINRYVNKMQYEYIKHDSCSVRAGYCIVIHYVTNNPINNGKLANPKKYCACNEYCHLRLIRYCHAIYRKNHGNK
jgi:hypothetical protein